MAASWKGRHALTGEAVEIFAENGRITAVKALEGIDPERLPWISSGWIDLQVNGFGGYDFNGERTTHDDLEGATRALHRHGVARYLPTVITGSFDRMSQAFAAIASHVRSGGYGAGSIAGIHMEGPYLSGVDGSRGAHSRDHIRDPDWAEFEELQHAAEGLIRMVTIAPERKGAIAMIERLAENGIVAAIGHTAADGDTLEAAVRAGATVSTHLGNGSQLMLPRHPNYIWHQLADDRLWGTFIADGHHLAPPVLKAMLRAKRGKAILVSDATKFAGMPPGCYTSEIGGEVVLTEGGRLHTAANPDILAGSASALDQAVANCVRYTDMALAEAVEAVTARPALAMNEPELGDLSPGSPAALTLFDADGAGGIRIRETVVAGETVFRREN